MAHSDWPRGDAEAVETSKEAQRLQAIEMSLGHLARLKVPKAASTQALRKLL